MLVSPPEMAFAEVWVDVAVQWGQRLPGSPDLAPAVPGTRCPGRRRVLIFALPQGVPGGQRNPPDIECAGRCPCRPSAHELARDWPDIIIAGSRVPETDVATPIAVAVRKTASPNVFTAAPTLPGNAAGRLTGPATEKALRFVLHTGPLLGKSWLPAGVSLGMMPCAKGPAGRQTLLGQRERSACTGAD